MSNSVTSIKKNMLFNTGGSLIYYACQWLMSIAIVRISGYEDAGILSIAMSVTASPAIIGLFNIRSYQVSDINHTFTDRVYLRSRTYTNVLSFIICAIMIFANGYTPEKVAAILTFMLYKLSEGYADVFYGIEQKRGRLDIAGISLGIRGVGALILFVLVFVAGGGMVPAIAAMTIYSFSIVALLDYRITTGWNREDAGEQKQATFREIRNLLITCLPLAVVAFLNNLSINIPRIYLEGYFGAEVMGYYSSVASPTVVIQLAATTIFAPLVPLLTRQYQTGERKQFLQTLGRFSGLVIALSAVCLVVCKLLGRWALIFLFQEGIDPYVYLFIPVVWVSILIAVNACMFSICTLLRIIKFQYLIGAVGLLTSWLLSVTLVKSYSMMGVVYALVGTLAAQILIQVIMVIHRIQGMHHDND